MIKFTTFLVFLTTLYSSAQNTSPEKEEVLTRTLRIMIIGERALPQFKKQGNQYVEVEPDSKDIFPTAFEIGKK